MEFCLKVPIVGYSYVTVEAENEEEAKEKALAKCCDFDNEDVCAEEIYGVEKVAEGNVLYHPCWEIEVENQEGNNE